MGWTAPPARRPGRRLPLSLVVVVLALLAAILALRSTILSERAGDPRGGGGESALTAPLDLDEGAATARSSRTRAATSLPPSVSSLPRRYPLRPFAVTATDLSPAEGGRPLTPRLQAPGRKPSRGQGGSGDAATESEESDRSSFS